MERQIDDHAWSRRRELDASRLTSEKGAFADPRADRTEMGEIGSTVARRDRDSERACGETVNATRRVALDIDRSAGLELLEVRFFENEALKVLGWRDSQPWRDRTCSAISFIVKFLQIAPLGTISFPTWGRVLQPRDRRAFGHARPGTRTASVR